MIKYLLLTFNLILVSYTHCKLTIIGSLYENYQLYDLLTSIEKSKIDSFHNFWIDNLIYDLQNENIIDNTEILDHFTKNDALEILKPILKINGFNLTDQLIKKKFKEKIFPEIDSEKSDLNFFKQTHVIEHLYETAIKVTEIIKDNILLVIGQTPAYLGFIINEINKLNNSNQKNSEIIFIPFSGRPDTIISRLKSNQKWNWTKASYKEILTKKRETFYRKFIEKKGFSPNKFNNKTNKKIYILDNSEGPAIASFLNLLCRWYKEESFQLPDLYFLNMDSYKKELDMRMNNNLAFKIDTIYLNMDHEILNIRLDQMYDNLRLQPHFNAYLWQDGIEDFIENYPKPECKKLLKIYKNFVKTKYDYDL